ncbi:MAG TPA: ABC transporter permease [Candidatus Limnocylindrales bacterium]|nr:ABC transporter permease [Candidatus Limnocylindrales bacterium]
MRSLLALTLANLRSFTRDRAALFWTLAFPVVFVILFGTIFAGGSTDYTLGWVDQDGTPPVQALHEAFTSNAPVELLDLSIDDARAKMLAGDLDGIIVLPKGLAEAVAAGEGSQTPPGPPVAITVITDPSRTSTSQAVQQIATGLVMAANLQLSGATPLLTIAPESLLTGRLNSVSFFVPSILAMALMQLGIFAAIPLVQQREKGILKRLNTTPLPRWALVGSNVIVRLIIAAAQTVIILGIGLALLGVEITGSPLLIAGFVVLGALAFTSIGYVIASFARTEEAANGMTSVVQFPLMFLSGIFFPLEVMPEWLRGVATFLPLTYLGDALRQTMVGGTPFAPLGVDALVLAGWLAVTLAISARYFRWQ